MCELRNCTAYNELACSGAISSRKFGKPLNLAKYDCLGNLFEPKVEFRANYEIEHF
jgi:hypothetical protein